jgi:hypothetical protein
MWHASLHAMALPVSYRRPYLEAEGRRELQRQQIVSIDRHHLCYLSGRGRHAVRLPAEERRLPEVLNRPQSSHRYFGPRIRRKG